MKELSRTKKVGLLILSVLLVLFVTVTSAPAKPWSFGVISDTQWTMTDDGKNPNTCAADIIRQVDKQFIHAGVKLVIAVGDTVDVGSKTSIDTRALYAQDLYNAGIGFYPLRGNHEAAEDPNYTLSGIELQYAFPQIGTGMNNQTPSDITRSIVPKIDLANNPPADKRGRSFVVGHNFSAPAAVNRSNKSISYSFDYKNTRFILLDQFDVTGSYSNSTIPSQQPWIDSRLSDNPHQQHAFVFVHKNLLGGNHKDNMFGGQVNSRDPGDGSGVDISTLDPESLDALQTKQQEEDEFITSLADNNVRFCFSGHDHNHYHSIISAPLTPGKLVHQLITQSDSSKFYTPHAPWSENDMPVSQDLYRVGYYIVTVDGPRVTIDYYGSDQTFPAAFSTTPKLRFVKRESFGYSLNGKEFLIAQGESYTNVQDTYHGTRARILSGTNSSAVKDNTGLRPFIKAVNTGWTSPTDSAIELPLVVHAVKKTPSTRAKHRTFPASDILTLWGLAGPGDKQTDTYTLSMSYDPSSATPRTIEISSTSKVQPVPLCRRSISIAARDNAGNWVNAVDLNIGGSGKFVLGPWEPAYELGTYGFDLNTNTAWAVINYTGDFAVVQDAGFFTNGLK